MPHDRSSKLDSYRAKRLRDETPEPWGDDRNTDPSRPRLFVIQKHAARHLHYDLRLEIGGTLRSWALPKGVTVAPEDKRAAIATEDHPLEYADFEGIIPKGSYGAGAMILWDRGFFVPLEDPELGIETGKLLFELKGYKLRGVWTLVQTKRNPAEWLLIKKPQGWAAKNGYRGRVEVDSDVLLNPGEESILSGLTVEELANGSAKTAAIRAELEGLRAAEAPVDPAAIEVMKPTIAPKAFSAPGWIFELKYDGFRVLAARQREGPRLYYRSGHDATDLFPELARALAALPYSVVMDGEVVILDALGRPSFSRLQKRGLLTRRADALRAAAGDPATLYLFDLLAWEGFDLRPLPLTARKAILRQILPKAGPLRYTDDLPEHGVALFREVERLGLEGVVAKKAASPYRSGRTNDWLKIRSDRVGDFIILGWAPATNAPGGIGKLHLGIHEAERLVYAGRVGTGFDSRELADIRQRATRRPSPAVAGLPQGSRHVWVEPELVCEVRFKEWTPGGNLRLPVFARLRDDKRPDECVRLDAPEVLDAPDAPQELEEADAAENTPLPSPSSPPPPSPPRPARRGRAPELSNLDKVFWPQEGYTKGDLLNYYREIAPYLLPYLKDRPLVIDRYPDGIEGKSFYQKNAPSPTVDWVRTIPIWGEGSAREIEYLLVDDADSLLAVINLGAIPLHLWSSRVQTLDRPDWTILDLDPKGAPFSHVVEIAGAIRALTEELGMPSFIKTSGGSGLHVLLPLAQLCTYEQSRQLAELLARVVVGELPKIATVERTLAARGGKVYVDYLQNGRGRLIAGPYSARPRPGATVSAPLLWDEVGSELDPRAFTIRTVPERARSLGADPLLPVLGTRPDLGGAIEKLAGRL
ncbi:MAG TPA: DNA ligase D [Thermoanaerobaculia bacterium]|nr:DNA ligase D [Thermoanaerobaculia bacterium]